MTSEERLTELERRIDFLEQLLMDQVEVPLQAKKAAWEDASNSVIRELAIHAGLSPGQYSQRFLERYHYYHDQYLQKAQSISPGLAAHLDDRNLEEIVTDESFPPLFPGESAE